MLSFLKKNWWRCHKLTASAIMVMYVGLGMAANNGDENQFVAHWFALIDQGEFDRTWDELATSSQQEWSQEDWLFSLKYVHEQIGSIDARYLRDRSIEYDPHANIEAIVLTFESDFALLKQATEIVRIRKENEVWKLVSYELKNPAREEPYKLYESGAECVQSFELDGLFSYVDTNSEPAMHLTDFLDGVATGQYSQVERFRIISDQEDLDEWRSPQCFLLSREIDVGGLYPDNFCFERQELAIEVIERSPDDVSYYTLRQRNGEWEISGWRSRESFEGCVAQERQ